MEIIANKTNETIQNVKSLTTSRPRDLTIIFQKYAILILFCITIGVYFYYADTNPEVLQSNTFVYALTILIPLFIYGLVSYKSALFKPEHRINILIGLGIILLFGVLVAFYYYLKPFSRTTIIVSSFFLNLIIVLFIVVGLAIYYNTFMNETLKQEGWAGFIAHFIFFIPCLFSDFIKYVLSEFNMTPMVVYVLFLIEISLVLLYIYVPRIMTKLLTHKGKSLLKEPVDLSIPTVISTSDAFSAVSDSAPDINKTNSSDNSDHILSNKNPLVNRNFGLSMWIYINPENLPNDKVIFKYGQPTEQTGSPCILYLGSNNRQKSDPKNTTQIKIIFTDKDETNSSNDLTSTIIVIPIQKWVHVVFNYHDNTADLFINGELKYTAVLTHNIPTYQNTDLVTVGDTNGVYGAICNVMYYNNVLTNTQIAQMYNLLYLQNPPINNLI